MKSKVIRKVVALVLFAFVVLALFGCAGEKPGEESPEGSSKEEEREAEEEVKPGEAAEQAEGENSGEAAEQSEEENSGEAAEQSEEEKPGEAAEQAEEEKPGEAAEAEEEVKPEEAGKPEELTQEDLARKQAFYNALIEFNTLKRTPDGYEYADDVMFPDQWENNEFAVYDVNGDGEEELIITFTSGPMAAMFERVYTYDEETGTLSECLQTFPSNNYYEDGFVKCGISHNQGMAGVFWPYTIFKYSEETGKYEGIAFIDAWDLNLGDTDYSGNKFPTEADKDGDGMVYYINEEYYPYDPEKIPEAVDGDYLDLWLRETMEGAELLTVPRRKLTAANLEEYFNNGLRTSDIKREDYQAFTVRDVTIYIPNEYMGSIRTEGGGDGIGFYHTPSEEVLKAVYNEEFGSHIFTFEVYDNYDYFNLPNYEHLTRAGNATYILVFPTDVQQAVPYMIEDCKQVGLDITEDDLQAISDDYVKILEYVRGIYFEAKNVKEF